MEDIKGHDRYLDPPEYSTHSPCDHCGETFDNDDLNLVTHNPLFNDGYYCDACEEIITALAAAEEPTVQDELDEVRESLRWKKPKEKMPTLHNPCLVQYYDGAIGILPLGGNHLTHGVFHTLGIQRWRYLIMPPETEDHPVALYQWRSVNDTLPTHDTPVLVWARTIEDEGPARGRWQISQAKRNRQGYWIHDFHTIQIEVTHWMPLPEPPEWMTQ